MSARMVWTEGNGNQTMGAAHSIAGGGDNPLRAWNAQNNAYINAIATQQEQERQIAEHYARCNQDQLEANQHCKNMMWNTVDQQFFRGEGNLENRGTNAAFGVFNTLRDNPACHQKATSCTYPPPVVVFKGKTFNQKPRP